GALRCDVLDWPEALPARLDALTEVCRQHAATALTGVINEERQRRIWAMREALSPTTARLRPTKISEDATVPIGKIPAFLADLEEIRERLQVDLMVFGHAGDGNFHPDVMCDERDDEEMRRVAQAIDAIFASALRHGGTLSGEHGIGLLKLPYMTDAIDAQTMRAMRLLKQAFDPDNLLNPGKLLPPEVAAQEEGGQSA